VNLSRLRQHLKVAEGLSLVPYTDTVGVWTIGYGHALLSKMEHEIADLTWTKAQAEAQLTDDLADAMHDASTFPWFQTLDAVRQEVMVELAFNLGLTRLRKFVRMLAAMQAKDWDKAAQELKDSRWYTQVGMRRGNRLVTALRTGAWPVTRTRRV